MDLQLKSICRYLKRLVSINSCNGHKIQISQKEAILKNLTSNVHCVFSMIEAENKQLYKVIKLYVGEHPSNKIEKSSWKFVMTCLVLMKSMGETLLALQNESKRQINDVTSSLEEESSRPGLLSVDEENTLRTVFQFITVLGILSNLIPGIRTILRTRIKALMSVEAIEEQISPYLKYQRLIFCLSVLSEISHHAVMWDIFLKSHRSDFLAALFQICYAPIKKIDDSTDRANRSSNCISEGGNSLPLCKRELYTDFGWLSKRLTVYNRLTDKEFICQMKEDREYFCSILKIFIQELSPSVLMWELLMLQNSRCFNGTGTNGKVPAWLKKICIEMLTDKLLEKNGVKTFIEVTLDKMCDVDMEAGSLTRHRIEAVSRLITENPVKHISQQKYVTGILEQVLDIMHEKDTSSKHVFTNVASSIILQFCEQNSQIRDTYVTSVVLKTFNKCLSEHQLVFDGEKLIDEDELTLCIEDVYKIFVANCPILQEEHIKMLLPFYHLFFVIYVKLQSGISFLRSRVQDILKVILKICSKDKAVLLLKMSAYDDYPVKDAPLVTNIKCVFGDSSGIEIIKYTKRNEIQDDHDDDSVENIDLRCQAITKLLEELSEIRLRVPFFLQLLKTAVQQSNDQNEGDEAKIFVQYLITVNLLENLSEVIGDDLFKNIEEAIEVIRGSLECAVHCKNKVISDESIMNFLIILSTLIGYKNELTSHHWLALKECIPALDLLIEKQKDDVVTNIASDICTAIRTHGAVMKNQAVPTMVKSQTSINITKSKKNVVNPEKVFYKQKSQECTKLTDDIKLVTEKLRQSNFSSSSDNKEQQITYELALKDLNDGTIPTRGHGLITLSQLIERRDKETLSHKGELLEIFKKNLVDEDSYIYLSAIRGLSSLGSIFTDEVLHVLLSEFLNFKGMKWDQTLKIGESLLKICQHFGELSPKYRDKLIAAYLAGSCHEDAHISASSLSNLAEVCKQMKFAIGPWLQEILFCVTSLLKTKADIEVKRSAALVITLILRGVGVDCLQVLESEMKELYRLLKLIYNTAKDDILKLQVQLALEEVSHIVKESFSTKSQLIKEIRVLDPL